MTTGTSSAIRFSTACSLKTSTTIFTILYAEKLPWTVNPFKLYSRLMAGLKPHLAQIQQERPQLARKIAMFRPELVLQLVKPAARMGFPNR